MQLILVHGYVETQEEQESLDALHSALEGHWDRIVGGGDTTNWHLRSNELPAEAEAVLQAGCETYSWWRVSRV